MRVPVTQDQEWCPSTPHVFHVKQRIGGVTSWELWHCDGNGYITVLVIGLPRPYPDLTWEVPA